MTDRLARMLLDRAIPEDIAASLFDADPALFADASNLTLREAFRLVLRPALVARQAASRGQRRGAMRKKIVRTKKAAASIDAETTALAIRMAARHVAADLEQQADRLAAIDPKAAKRLRKAAQAALDAGNVEASRIMRVRD